MSSLVSFVKKATKPTESVQIVEQFISDLGELESHINLVDNNSEEFKVLLKHQDFDPDVKVSKINNVICAFRSISENSIDLTALNSTIRNFGIKFYGIEDHKDGSIVVFFKKLANCIV